MSVSIVLATYNGEPYLPAQLDSLLTQDEQDWKLIIRDDGSTDGTPALLQEYARKHPERIVLLQDEKRMGIIGNFSALLAATTSDYVMCCDQDDVWLPEKISLTLQRMRELERGHGASLPLLVYTDAIVTDASLQVRSPSCAAMLKLEPETSPFARLLMQNTVQGCTMMLNRALLRQALPIPPEARMHDMWLALVASGLGQMAYLPKPTLYYRQHPQNAVGVGSPHKGRIGRIRKMLQENAAQAECYLQRFAAQLSPQKRSAAAALAKFSERGFWERRYELVRLGLLRRPYWQNIPILLFA